MTRTIRGRSVILMAIILAALVGCSSKPTPSTEPVELRASTQPGAAEMALVGPLYQTEEYMGSQEAMFWVVWNSADIARALMTGEMHIGVVPPNVAAMAYANGGNIRIASINTLGGYYMLAKGYDIQSMEDLAGKEVTSGGPGETPNIVMDILLDQYGLTDKVDMVYEEYPPYITELLMASTEDMIIILPEPYAEDLIQFDPEFVRVMDLGEEFEKVTGVPLVTSVTVVNKDFEDVYPHAVNAFLDASQRSTQFVLESPEAAGEFIHSATITTTQAAATASIATSGIVYMTGQEAKTLVLQYLSAIYVFNPETLGNSPPSDFIFPI